MATHILLIILRTHQSKLLMSHVLSPHTVVLLSYEQHPMSNLPCPLETGSLWVRVVEFYCHILAEWEQHVSDK